MDFLGESYIQRQVAQKAPLRGYEESS